MERIRQMYSQRLLKLLDEADSFCENKLHLHIDIAGFINEHLGTSDPIINFFSDQALNTYSTFSLDCEDTISGFITSPQETPADIDNLIIKTLDFTKRMERDMYILDAKVTPLRAVISYSFRRVCI